MSETASYTILTFRGAEFPEWYRNMIYARWMRSLRFHNDYFKLIDSDSYYATYQRYIEGILKQKDTQLRMAVLTEDHDVALGFSVYRGNKLDYVHVQKDMLRLGVGTKLIPTGIDTITHLTKTGIDIWKRKYPHWKFNPFV